MHGVLCAVCNIWFTAASSILILFNVVTMCMYQYSVSPRRHTYQRTTELVLAVLFVMEDIVRCIAAGLGLGLWRPQGAWS